jgi:putative ABC transport system substrate-binding protein
VSFGKRRQFLIAAGGLFASPFVCAQQPGKTARIGVLATSAFFLQRFESFRKGLLDLGHVDGKSVVFEIRNAEGRFDRLPNLAAELVQLKVDLIFTASAEGILAAMKATSTIPIVFGAVQDPVASGIVVSLARPGRNATGMSAVSLDLGRKRLELLKEAVPGLVRVAYFWSPLSAGAYASLKEMQDAARALQLQLQSLEVRESKDLESAFDAARKARAQALITNPDPFVNAERERISKYAATHRLPAMYAAPEWVEPGGLMSYAPSYADLFRRSANHADKILKGANPADLPVEQPIKFELIVNLTTAKALGLTMPQSLLMRADRVIK